MVSIQIVEVIDERAKRARLYLVVSTEARDKSESAHSLCRDGTHSSTHQYELPDNVSTNRTLYDDLPA